MDGWDRAMASKLVAGTPGGAQAEADASLEVAFGQVRAAVVYVLELGRAHRVGVAGSITGDDIWIQLGAARVRFTLSRRDRHVVVRPGDAEGQLARWDDATRRIVDAAGGPYDLAAAARQALDALVERWTADAMPLGSPATLESARELDDVPTKG